MDFLYIPFVPYRWWNWSLLLFTWVASDDIRSPHLSLLSVLFFLQGFIKDIHDDSLTIAFENKWVFLSTIFQ